jgi:hypothetical protein
MGPRTRPLSLGTHYPVDDRKLAASRGRHFPLLDPENYRITSEETDDYNCVGWAASEVDPGQWWPLPDAPEYYWPPGARTDETLEAFEDGFGRLGYVSCDDHTFDVGFEKIVVYASRGVPTHVARQLPDGGWTSKLGSWEDIEHEEPRDLAGGLYGQPALFMRRPV